MPMFSDLSNLSHYYSGGSSSLNYLAGPYAGHSSIVAANYRGPSTSSSPYTKPSSRVFSNRNYKPHLATISENQITRVGLSRINSPKLLYHSSPKYKIRKPISINTADIDVSSNRYRSNLDRSLISSQRKDTNTINTPERTPSFKENKDETTKDGDDVYMPRIDKNYRSTIKRERTMVRLHTIRNMDEYVDTEKTEADESPPKRDSQKQKETVKVPDGEIKVHKQKWRENFDPDELKPKKRVQQKPLGERLVEKFMIKDKEEKEEEKIIEERRRQREENLMNFEGSKLQRRGSRKSIKKVPSFHDICKTISSESIDEDLNPGQNIKRRYTRKLSNYDVMKAIRRDSAEFNQQEIEMLDDLIKEEHLDGNNLTIHKPENTENEDPKENTEDNDTKRRKKFTKKKSNEKLVDDEVKEEKLAQRRKIVKKKTSGNLDKAIEAITPKETKENVCENSNNKTKSIVEHNNIQNKENEVKDERQRRRIVKKKTSGSLEQAIEAITPKTKNENELEEKQNKRVLPKITGTVEIETKPNLKLVIDNIHVEETILSSSSPNTKKFKYNITIEEVVSPVVEKGNIFKSKIIEESKKQITLDTIEKENNKIMKSEEQVVKKVDEKNKMVNKLLDKKELVNKPLEFANKAEIEKTKMLDKLLGKKEAVENPIENLDKAEMEKNKMLDKLLVKKGSTEKPHDSLNKAEEEKNKMLDKLLGKKESVEKPKEHLDKAEMEKNKMLDKLLGKKDSTEKPQDSLNKAEEEKSKMLDKFLGKKVSVETPKEHVDNAEIEKNKMLNKLLDKKASTEKSHESLNKAEEEETKMLDKLLNKHESTEIQQESVNKTEEEKKKMLDKILDKKESVEKQQEDLHKAELEKKKMLDKLLGKKELTEKQEKLDDKVEEQKNKIIDKLLDKKISTEKVQEPITKAEEEKNKMFDKLIGKKILIEKLQDSPVNKAEDEKNKMLDKLLSKKESEKQNESKPKAEEEKNKMLDKILGKKENIQINKEESKTETMKLEEIKKAETPKIIEMKKSNEEQNVKLEDKSKSVPKQNIFSKFGQKVAPKSNKTENNIEKANLNAAARRKQIQKQDNLDELDIDNFWERMGKRETIYYKDRRKYLEEKREREKKEICWMPDWAMEEEDTCKTIEVSTVNEDKQFALAKSSSGTEKLSARFETPNTSLEKSTKNVEKMPVSVETPLKVVQKAISLDKPELNQEKSSVNLVKTSESLEKLSVRFETPINSMEKSTESVEKVPVTMETPSKVVEKVISLDKPKLNQEKLAENLAKISQSLEKPSDLEKSKPTLDKLSTIPNKTSASLDKQSPSPDKPSLNKSATTLNKAVSNTKSTPDKLLPTPEKSPQNLEPPKPKLSVKQNSVECDGKIRPRLQRQSKSEEQFKRERLKLTALQLEEMKAEIKEIKLEPIKPELDFIIKEQFDPVLKPNTDLIVPSASEVLAIEKAKEEAKKAEENKEKKTDEDDDEKDKSFVPLQTNLLAVPDPKPKPKPKWFDECPVVIMATPRDLRTRAPVHRGRPEPVPKVTYASESEDSGSSDEESTSSDSSGGSDEYETNIVFDAGNANKWKSTSSNDSGFDSSAPGSPANNRNRPDDCDVNCHKKCEKLTANLCGVNQKMIVEALRSVKKGSTNASTSSGSESSSTLAPAHNPAFTLEPMEASSAYTAYQRSGRVTPPATSIPRFRKYTVEDFSFLKVLGKGSFGKVLLAELKNTEYYYAVKCLKKDIVLEDDDVECTLIERKVLALGTKHPYLCHLFCTFQTESHLFFVMEYLNGGDLMFHIQVSGRFPEPRGRFYGAEIVSGLKFLHSKGIVYRDLKLDNILLDFDGHVRIADFGMCKLQIFLDRTADTFCGTPDYMAPEIIKGQHYNQGVDWWSFGVLLYEMLIGQSPFSGCDEDELFWSICNERPVIPAFLSKEASQILTLLLEKDSSKRLGNRYCPAGDIKEQPFFHQIDWDKLERRQLEAPFKPKVQHPLDTQYFDKAFTAERVKLTPIEKDILHSMDQTQFHGFSYTNPNATDK